MEFTVFLFVCLYGYRFLSGGKSYGREISHACWPTIRTGLLPFWRSKVKGQGHQGQKTRSSARSGSADAAGRHG